MKPSWFSGLLALAFWSLAACGEETPTIVNGGGLPVSPTTVQVTLPFDDFVNSLSVWGGYGRPVELSHGVVAREYDGALDARTLAAWQRYPVSASVRDTTGTTRPDANLTFLGGRVVAVFDTLSSTFGESVTLGLGAIQDDWDPLTATWTLAVDSVGEQRSWPEEGAGPVLPLATSEWIPSEGDSAVFELDSAAVALWTDSVAARKGFRLDALTQGVRLNVRDLRLLLTTRPGSRPDTLLHLTVSPRYRTFVYNPTPEVPQGEIRVGGVPAWRTVLELDLPEELTLTPDLCAQVGCPVPLTADALVSAILVLRTETPPRGFHPPDTLRMDVREVLELSRLPKSPLGFTMVGFTGIRVPPRAFGEEEGTEVLIPLGQYVETLIRARSDPEIPVSNSMALLSSLEPLSLYFGSFSGPGTPNEPVLRLILTFGEGVQIR